MATAAKSTTTTEIGEAVHDILDSKPSQTAQIPAPTELAPAEDETIKEPTQETVSETEIPAAETAEPVEKQGVPSESLSHDDLSSNQAETIGKGDEGKSEIAIEPEMTFAAPSSPVPAPKATKAAEDNSVPGECTCLFRILDSTLKR